MISHLNGPSQPSERRLFFHLTARKRNHPLRQIAVNCILWFELKKFRVDSVALAARSVYDR